MRSFPLRAVLTPALFITLIALTACSATVAEEETAATETALVGVCDATHTGETHDSSCAANEFCGKMGCARKKVLGLSCNRDAMCRSGNCASNFFRLLPEGGTERIGPFYCAP